MKSSGVHFTANLSKTYTTMGIVGDTRPAPHRAQPPPDKGLLPADPIDTTIPKGTILFVESFHIQKGHEPRLTLRIKKGNPTKIQCGKFTALIDDINKMDVETDFVEKYPKGRFAIRITTGVDRETYRCKCHNYPCVCGFPKHTDHVISWESDPDASRNVIKRAGIRHRTDETGVDKLEAGGFSYYSRQSNYTKHFDNINECLTWAGKKSFTKSHIDAFIKAYEPERTLWEQSKA